MPGFELWGAEERAHLQDVLDNGILMRYGFDGPRKDIWKSKELEKAVCATFGVKHAQLVSSGTAALTTAMSALGIGYGDEVIMPSFTFVASFEAVLSVGAVPVLVDVDDTLTLAPAAVRAAITPKTKCIMPVHMCGSMADMDALQLICKEHGLLLLEDACQSIGGSYKGKMLGSIGDAGTFSFDFGMRRARSISSRSARKPARSIRPVVVRAFTRSRALLRHSPMSLPICVIRSRQ